MISAQREEGGWGLGGRLYLVIIIQTPKLRCHCVRAETQSPNLKPIAPSGAACTCTQHIHSARVCYWLSRRRRLRQL